jgi:hypothetical protein
MKNILAAALCMLMAMPACTKKKSSQSDETAGLLALLSVCDPAAVEAPIDRNGYPLLAGMNIGKTYYDDTCYQANIARLDLVILGFYKGWGGGPAAIQAVVQNIKAINPRIEIGQYSVLTEMYDDAYPPTDEIRAKLDAMNWWVLNAEGNKVQWTSQYNAYEVNITVAAGTDSNGYRYPQWFAHWMYDNFFSPAPEFDIWYFDNVFPKPRAAADYNLDGEDDSPDDPTVQQAYRSGVVSEWAAARVLKPGIACIGNVSDLTSAEYSNQLDGGFLEALMGETYSIESAGTWTEMMAYYRSVSANVKDPRLVIFNVHGSVHNYALLRYGLASCLLGNGHFAYSDIFAGYSSVPWFDEYNISLGQPAEIPPTAAWQNGVYRRLFDYGMVLVNPRGNGRQTVTVESGYRRISGSQSPSVNNGQPVTDITINERDGIILKKI